ncbi:MAG: Mur ligase family protein, partial [Butyricimonas faecihominis]
IIEVGLGGRLDSTNIITPLASVITNISFDHMALLGDTLEKIAHEKAGIIKPGVPAIIGTKDPASDFVFIEKAKECETTLEFASENWQVTRDNKNAYRLENKNGIAFVPCKQT